MSLGGSKELLFHSRSKTDDGRYLSTMQVSPKPLVYKGNLFATMEHAYHWEKFDENYASHPIPSRLLEFRKRLQKEGDIVDPKEAKKYGGKMSFKKLKVTLDAAKFNPDRVEIMTEIALARIRVDPKFAEILLKANTDGVILKHHERGKKDMVFWGGTQNNLGNIYMKIGNTLSKKETHGDDTKEEEEEEGNVSEAKKTNVAEEEEEEDPVEEDPVEEDPVEEDPVEEDPVEEEDESEESEVEDPVEEEDESEESDVEDPVEEEAKAEVEDPVEEEEGSSSESDGEEGGDKEEKESSDEEEDEEYLQKFDKDVRSNFLTEFHPESSAHNDVEVRRFASVVRNKDGDIIDDLHRTIPFLTKYEYTRIIGQRAKQIDSGALPFVEVRNDIIDGDIIAKMELEAKKIPFIIRRPMPGGGCEYWKLEDLEILH